MSVIIWHYCSRCKKWIGTLGVENNQHIGCDGAITAKAYGKKPKKGGE